MNFAATKVPRSFYKPQIPLYPLMSPHSSALFFLPRRRRRFLSEIRLLSAAADDRPNLSARLAFVFDAIDRDRSRELSKPPEEEEESSLSEFLKKEAEVVHPWPEWIDLLGRLGRRGYLNRRTVVEYAVADGAGIDLSGIKEEVGFDFSRDWNTVRKACIDFGRDRFDILESLPRKKIQVLVGHGCPSLDPRVVSSAKLLRKHVGLDEGDVCSSCSLRNSCGRGYILTHKKDEARTLDVMHILLTFGFDHVNGAVENKPLMKMKTVKTVVRKLLHEVVKLSDVPIDPNLPPPLIKKPLPKIKQLPPPPKKRIGQDDVEMKKGDWLCPKCDFMNFAKNNVCLQCDAKRPKRQLLPGEWECPQCFFLNYSRNMSCFHCNAKRPQDEFMENKFMRKHLAGPQTRMERATRMQDVSNAWNFDFDDNESDGADVAAFEFADPSNMCEDSAFNDLTHGRIAQGFEDDTRNARKVARSNERGRYFSDHDETKSTSHWDRTGFDDFDDEEGDVDNYEIDGSTSNQAQEVSRNCSEVEDTSGSEEFDGFDRQASFNQNANDYFSGSEDDEPTYQHHWNASHIAGSWQKS